MIQSCYFKGDAKGILLNKNQVDLMLTFRIETLL